MLGRKKTDGENHDDGPKPAVDLTPPSAYRDFPVALYRLKGSVGLMNKEACPGTGDHQGNGGFGLLEAFQVGFRQKHFAARASRKDSYVLQAGRGRIGSDCPRFDQAHSSVAAYPEQDPRRVAFDRLGAHQVQQGIRKFDAQTAAGRRPGPDLRSVNGRFGIGYLPPRRLSEVARPILSSKIKSPLFPEDKPLVCITSTPGVKSADVTGD